METKPIADLFPNTTVFFADIAGFTAWSSVREPSQVFTLLETVYKAFDKTAKRRKVFKVETVGDCYVSMMTQEIMLPVLITISFNALHFIFRLLLLAFLNLWMIMLSSCVALQESA